MTIQPGGLHRGLFLDFFPTRQPQPAVVATRVPRQDERRRNHRQGFGSKGLAIGLRADEWARVAFRFVNEGNEAR
jgi:hypothetical protein